MGRGDKPTEDQIQQEAIDYVKDTYGLNEDDDGFWDAVNWEKGDIKAGMNYDDDD